MRHPTHTKQAVSGTHELRPLSGDFRARLHTAAWWGDVRRSHPRSQQHWRSLRSPARTCFSERVAVHVCLRPGRLWPDSLKGVGGMSYCAVECSNPPSAEQCCA